MAGMGDPPSGTRKRVRCALHLTRGIVALKITASEATAPEKKHSSQCAKKGGRRLWNNLKRVNSGSRLLRTPDRGPGNSEFKIVDTLVGETPIHVNVVLAIEGIDVEGQLVGGGVDEVDCPAEPVVLPHPELRTRRSAIDLQADGEGVPDKSGDLVVRHRCNDLLEADAHPRDLIVLSGLLDFRKEIIVDRIDGGRAREIDSEDQLVGFEFDIVGLPHSIDDRAIGTTFVVDVRLKTFAGGVTEGRSINVTTGDDGCCGGMRSEADQAEQT